MGDLAPLVQADAVLDGLSTAEVQFARNPSHPFKQIAFGGLQEET